MATVQVNQSKCGRRMRQLDGRRSKKTKTCAGCQRKTRWLSVEKMCWECTINTAKNRIPIFIEPQDEEKGNPERFAGSMSYW